MASQQGNFTCYYDLDLPKIFVIGTAFCINAVNILLLYGVIWYERFGSDSKRLLRNRIVSSSCWYGMFGVPAIYLMEAINYITGPKSTLYCSSSAFLRSLVHTNGLLIMNWIAVVRYILLFWRKNPASVNDEFWSVFISMWTIGFSSVYDFVMGFLPRQVRKIIQLHKF